MPFNSKSNADKNPCAKSALGWYNHVVTALSSVKASIRRGLVIQWVALFCPDS
jgi:hypothetical protein